MGLTYQQKAQLAAWELVRKDKDITQLDLLKCGPHIDAIYHVFDPKAYPKGVDYLVNIYITQIGKITFPPKNVRLDETFEMIDKLEAKIAEMFPEEKPQPTPRTQPRVVIAPGDEI